MLVSAVSLPKNQKTLIVCFCLGPAPWVQYFSHQLQSTPPTPDPNQIFSSSQISCRLVWLCKLGVSVSIRESSAQIDILRLLSVSATHTHTPSPSLFVLSFTQYIRLDFLGTTKEIRLNSTDG